MAPDRHRDFWLDLWGMALLLPLLAMPLLFKDPFILSLTYQFAIGVAASLSVYVMLRMGLLSFTVPAFMAVGGYAAAMLAKSGVTEIMALMLASFVLPMIFAVPLGLLVLKLKGLYFIFITFIFNEILQLIIFETPKLTGGSDGVVGVPAATFLGADLGVPWRQVFATVAVCLIASVIAFAASHRYRAEFTSIEENETLAESLGVAVWKYRMIGYIVSAGVAGLAGLALVNMLGTAHPSSFASWSVNNYIAYVFVGGRGTVLGVVVGSYLLIYMTNVFNAYAHLSAGLFGLLLIAVMMAAPGGVVGTAVKLFGGFRADKGDAPRPAPAGGAA
ncbi:MAG: branched-chain amino acid ABC transporter permease [Methylobacteriaceae bacterium]|nr:branched-chain amino acid ABC transporter permease [Methylobacteriaceae bacterium]